MENGRFEACRVWELIPVEVGDFPAQPFSTSVPPRDSPYEGSTGDRCSTCSHLTTETGDDGLGTTVVEVTTVITRRKYRLEDQ